MKRIIYLLVFVVLPSAILSAQSEIPFFKKHYDPKADPAVDLKSAIVEAQHTGRNILLDVGGEWCIWCHRLDSLFEQNPGLSDFLLKNYVPLKINVDSKNRNKEFLAQFPEIEGYPHLFVLNSDGKLTHSQETGALEEGKHHSPEKMMAFLKEWAPQRQNQ